MGWWLTGLFDLDEGFYGAVVREMLRNGDWIIPHYNGEPWFEKPILFYWLAAPCVRLFGEDIGPRLPSVVAAMGLYALVGTFCARRMGPAAGRWCVIVLATSPFWAALGRLMLVDAVFVLMLSASFMALYASFARPGLRAGSGALLGLAVLAKGPVAIILWLLLMGVTVWRTPRLRETVLAWGPNTAALGAMAAVIAVWYLPAYIQGGQAFVDDFLIKQNLGRFTGGDQAHRVDWYLFLPYYGIVIVVGMLPWVWRVVQGWPRKSGAEEPESTLVQFCAHWALVVVIFFTISGSKLPHYVLPAFVPLAILAGRTLRTQLFGLGTLLWGVLLGLILNGIALGYYESSGQREAHDLIRWIGRQPGSPATYQLSRRQSDKGTGKPTLQDTSLPSLSFYLDRPLLNAESMEEFLGLKGPVWILTRQGRIGADEEAFAAAHGLRLSVAGPSLHTEKFAVYRLEAR